MGPRYLGRSAGVNRGETAYNPPAMLSLTINGVVRSVDVDPDCPLLYVLRDTLRLDNPRFGCGLGQCGACTVLLDNRAVRSCVTSIARAAGKRIVTIEGLGAGGRPHRVQQAFIDAQAFQCGYCLNGWVMTAAGLLETTPRPDDEHIRRACAGLVCRCGSHVGILEAMRALARA
jgi:nicotinate dehydrogenase subunit A